MRSPRVPATPRAGATLALGLLLLSCRSAAPPPAGDEAGRAPSARAAPSASPRAATAADPSPEEVLAEMKAIAVEVRAGDNFYLGERPLEEFRRRLGASATPREELPLRLRVAWELLKLGDPEGALAELDRCEALVEAHGGGVPARKLVLGRLALAHLRAGETQNCVERHDAQSCIFPLEGGGVHGRREHARRAATAYLRLLEMEPGSRTHRWLLALAAMQAGDYPGGVPENLRLPDALLRPGVAFPRFQNVAPLLGISRMDMAGGAIAEDFDGDGFLDLMFSTCDPDASLAYYRARGDGTFVESTVAARLHGQLGGLNVMQADYDGDGRPDVLVTRGGWQGGHGLWRLSLLRNDGDGGFTDVTRRSGLALDPHPTQAAAWGDHDGDGDLDLFVGHEVDAPPVSGFGAEGQAFPSRLFRANGDGTFTDVAAAAGVTNDRMCKGAAWGDMDDDGDLDLYVSNVGPNRMYENRGDGTFVDVAPERGLTAPEGRSFATWFWDYDNDGHLDVFVAGFRADVESVVQGALGEPVDPSVERPRLYRGLGGGQFEELSAAAGLDGAWLPMGANHGDLDNDGYPDIYLGTGDPLYETLVPNVMLRNVGGRRFEDVTVAGGFGHLQKGHGIAFADLDEDGDQDVVLQTGGFFPGDRSAKVIYENPGAPGRWITLRLSGTRANRAGFGARIRVRVATPAGPRDVHALGGTGGSFGASSLQQEIGLGDATRIEEVEIRWPGSGTRQVLRDVPLDAVVTVREGDAVAVPAPRRPVRLGGARSPGP